MMQSLLTIGQGHMISSAIASFIKIQKKKKQIKNNIQFWRNNFLFVLLINNIQINCISYMYFCAIWSWTVYLVFLILCKFILNKVPVENRWVFFYILFIIYHNL